MTDKLTKKELKELRSASQQYHKDDPAYKKADNFEFVLYLLFIIAIALAVRMFVFEPVRVDGNSMYPTLYDGERMFVNKTAYLFDEPERGEVVICFYPDHTLSCVKRVIAKSGETVKVSDGIVYVNGAPLDESAYWNDVIWGDMQELTVPKNTVFVMGDNRNDSLDSRAASVGPIPDVRVVGSVKSVIWPIAQARAIN